MAVTDLLAELLWCNMVTSLWLPNPADFCPRAAAPATEALSPGHGGMGMRPVLPDF
jgi:hypothetical protein